MGHGSFVQTSFLGGAWSPKAQGRMDSDRYKTALAQNTNYQALEEGSLSRRVGTKWIGHTLPSTPGSTAPARVIGFDFQTDNPYQLEFSDGFLRLIQGEAYVTDATLQVTSISSATPAVVLTSTAHGLSNNDIVIFDLPRTSWFAAWSNLMNRHFIVSVVDTTHFGLIDAVPQSNIIGADVALTGGAGYNVKRIAKIVSPYVNGDWKNIRAFQTTDTLVLLCPGYAPRKLVADNSVAVGFSLQLMTFTDGPYFDINTTATTFTLSAKTGSVTLTASAVTGINNGAGFQTTDVGRLVRLYTRPADWDATSNSYVVGDQVFYTDGNAYTAIKNDNGPAANHGIAAPPTNIDHWSLLAYMPFWCYGTITARTSTTQVTVSLVTPAFNTLATATWQLGAYSVTSGYPTCGTFHEGRLWLGGVIPNRLDASQPGDMTLWSPTEPDGTVADSSGLSFTVTAPESNPIFWMQTDESGLIFGTQSSEWRIKASTLDDPITPTSVQARRISKFGSANIEPILAHRMHVFVQRQGRKVIELGQAAPIADGTLALTTSNLTLTAAHLTISGIAELAWVQEPNPTIWARRNDGVLVGCSYKREGDSVYAAWDDTSFGDPFNNFPSSVSSISSGPSVDGTGDRLYLVVSDGRDTSQHNVITTVREFDDEQDDEESWFVDGGIIATLAKLATKGVEGFDGIRIGGCLPFLGGNASVVIGGIDCGDFPVQGFGSTNWIDVPFNPKTGFTSIPDIPTGPTNVIGGPNSGVSRVTVGHAYTSQGQLLRPDHGNDAGAANGPAFAKIRRVHQYGLLLDRTRDIQIGTDFDNMYNVPLLLPGRVAITTPSLYSDIVAGTLPDNPSFKGQIAFQQSRPTPGTVLAVSGYIATQDK